MVLERRHIMSTSKQRAIGGLLLVLAVAIVPVMALANVSLVTRSSKHLVDTGVTSSSVHLHWPLIIPAILFALGLVLVLFPRHDHAEVGNS